MMKKRLLLLIPILALLASCAAPSDGAATPSPSSGSSSGGKTSAPISSLDGSSTASAPVIDTENSFSSRDLDPEYDESKSARIQLNGNSITCSSDAVKISGTTATITDEGTYVISGSLNNGMIVVNSDKKDKTQLVLDGADIRSETSAPIYVLQADKVFLTLAEGTENTLSNGGSFEAIDDNNIDSVIFSKEDLTLNGTGSLTISSPGGHGIVSKDDLTVTGGTYNITTASHGITCKDALSVTGAVMTIAAGKDGIHSENDEDSSLGTLYIQSGTFSVTAEGDGLSAGSSLQIDGGTFDLLTGGGSENAAQKTSDAWGSMAGMVGHPGGMGRPGNMGGRPGQVTQPTANVSTSEDSTSIKGIKAAASLIINGGAFTINSADDALHSNGTLTVNGGTFTISTGDDGFHADDTLSIVEGKISISESYEGLEGLHILVSGGCVDLVSSDDGLNAAGGTDSSGMGGFRGGDMFGGSSNGSIVISGGELHVNASGDGIDANGYLEITGGYTVVVGPTVGDTATLDYDTSATISGGTFIGTGSSMMAQTFSSGSTQGVFAVSVGSRSSGTQVTLTDKSGKELLSFAPELDFAVVILSSPDIVSGTEYTIEIDGISGTFAAA